MTESRKSGNALCVCNLFRGLFSATSSRLLCSSVLTAGTAWPTSAEVRVVSYSFREKFANAVSKALHSTSAKKRKPLGGYTVGTRGPAGRGQRELRSLTALLVERNGAQKATCRARGDGWGKRSLVVRLACGPRCSATTPRITFVQVLRPTFLSHFHRSWVQIPSGNLGNERIAVHQSVSRKKVPDRRQTMNDSAGSV